MLTWFILGFLLIVVAGAIVVWRVRRLRSSPSAANLPEVGYGRARWERELALWEGTLQRLHTQAARYSDLPPHLAREIERTEARIARARAALAKDEEGDGNGALRVEQ